eukprot:2331393-Pyramimonas_sp.AAC.2
MLAAQLCCKYVATTRNKTRFHLWYVQQAAACTVTCAHTTVHSAHPLIPLRTKGCVRACKVVYVQLSWKPALTGGTAFQVEPGLGWCYPESASIATQVHGANMCIYHTCLVKLNIAYLVERKSERCAHS